MVFSGGMMKNLNIIGPINQLGYGIASLNIIKSLHTHYNLSLWVIGQPQVTSQEDANILSKLIHNSQSFDFKAPCIKVWHQHDMAQFSGKGERIGFPIFELDEFNEIEKHSLSSLDRIFVCSSWAKDVILNNINISKDLVNVVPLGVDSSLFQINNESTENATVFFNCGKWEIRKGHDIIPEVFSEAFDVNDNVELWMMNSNPFLSEEDNKNWQNLYKSSKLGSKIKFINRVNSHNEVYNIMRMADCGLFPSRAEGWNLELIEMLSCGKHVITTNYSAHTEFCNSNNAFLIDIDEKELAFDGQWFHGKCGRWAKIGNSQRDQMIAHMRTVHKMKQENHKIINTSGRTTAEVFSWNNTANKIMENIYV
jgi:glycosyltransferase involved in cell wall biosynthesis